MESEKKEYLDALKEIIDHSYKLENEFIELKNLTTDVIDFLPDALWVFDEKGEIVIQNSKAKLITPLITQINSTIASSEVAYEGKIYLVKSTDENGKLIISATDITEQKRAQRLTSMGKIAAHLSHEIRNPIGAISLLTSTLEKMVNEDKKEIVSEMKKAIYRVERIIKSTLLFSKGVDIKRKTFALSKLQDSIEDSYEHYSMSKDIELLFEFGDATIDADFDLLSIVMQNFLYNAIDAIEEDEDDEGVVSFLFEKGCIIIKDSGVPIADKSILFEAFQSSKLKGSGLGLALSLEIVKAHDGTIELLENEKGFKICLG